jgi:hypothetical protein
MTDVAPMSPRYGIPATDLGASETSHRLYQRQKKLEGEQRATGSDPYASPSDAFGDLVEEWRAATSFSSSASEIVAHPAYLRIIGLGKRVLPLVLKDLSRGADHWFVALAALTGADPVSPDDWGDLEQMRNTWLRWARARNLL